MKRYTFPILAQINFCVIASIFEYEIGHCKFWKKNRIREITLYQSLTSKFCLLMKCMLMFFAFQGRQSIETEEHDGETVSSLILPVSIPGATAKVHPETFSSSQVNPSFQKETQSESHFNILFF